MHKKVVDKVLFTIEEIEQIFTEFELFFEDMDYEEPDLTQITVMASIVHSFYNGIEKIFEFIAKYIDKSVPHGLNSHKELLENMKEKNENRCAVISEDTFEILKEYMTFRHFYRHTYASILKWSKFDTIATDLKENWETIKSDILKFIDTLDVEEGTDENE